MLSRTVSNLLIQKTDAVCRRFRLLFYRAQGMVINGDGHLRRISVCGNLRAIRIDEGTYLDDYVSLTAFGEGSEPKIWIGKSCGFNRFTVIEAHEGVRIGDGARIGPACIIIDRCPAMAADDRSGQWNTSAIHIGAGTWLGAGVVVNPGVTIGDGAIIGAGSVVTGDIPPNTIAVGSPARVVRLRT